MRRNRIGGLADSRDCAESAWRCSSIRPTPSVLVVAVIYIKRSLGCVGGRTEVFRWDIFFRFSRADRGHLSMQEAEHHGHEKQSGESGEEEAADDAAAKRRILFAAFTETERHGKHADNHRRRRHDDWA